MERPVLTVLPPLELGRCTAEEPVADLEVAGAVVRGVCSSAGGAATATLTSASKAAVTLPPVAPVLLACWGCDAIMDLREREEVEVCTLLYVPVVIIITR